jgi:hypothetical protein
MMRISSSTYRTGCSLVFLEGGGNNESLSGAFFRFAMMLDVSGSEESVREGMREVRDGGSVRAARC